MKLIRTCETCEFGTNSDCCFEKKQKNERKASKSSSSCDEWGASLAYFSEITEKAPWYIKEPYRNYYIDYPEFLRQIEKDSVGVGIVINIYDAIEKIYDFKIWELAGVLDVPISVIGYARSRGTTIKRKRDFSSRLHIPEEFFDGFLSTQLQTLEKCRDEFNQFYGDKMIEKLKMNGMDAMDAKLEQDILKDKTLNEKYREANQYKYQYEGKSKMYHDLSDDYKSRDYVIAITLKDGDYFGNIFYEYSSGGYGLTTTIMEDILNFIESLDCSEINCWNEEGLLNNNIGLRADINGKEIHFELRNKNTEIMKKTIPEGELQKYIIGYEMIRCDGHGMKKERRRCSSCKKFYPIEGCAKGKCSARGDEVQRSRIICAFDYVVKEMELL